MPIMRTMNVINVHFWTYLQSIQGTFVDIYQEWLENSALNQIAVSYLNNTMASRDKGLFSNYR